jgi:hypothetical protein
MEFKLLILIRFMKIFEILFKVLNFEFGVFSSIIFTSVLLTISRTKRHVEICQHFSRLSHWKCRDSNCTYEYIRYMMHLKEKVTGSETRLSE